MENMIGDLYDIAVIGGGAAGCMAAICASGAGARVILAERNAAIGKKILITGNGRCNVTNTLPAEDMLEKFGSAGQFLRSALFSFSNEDLMEFFKAKGLELKEEEKGCVFPSTGKARSVTRILEASLKENGATIAYDTRVTAVERNDKCFVLITENGARILSKKVILASGGVSYPDTGSTGDGFEIAGCLGHTILPLRPALVPLTVKESWISELQGVGLTNVRLVCRYGKKKIISDVGDVMLTHFGISGPLALDISGEAVSLIEQYKELALEIDLVPDRRREELEVDLLNMFCSKGGAQLKTLMQEMAPKRLVSMILALLKIDQNKLANQVMKKEREAIVGMLKGFPLTVAGSLEIASAMVTAGGISRKEIDPRTMMSRIVPGLYFAGEIIEGAAKSGGYNLQQAFSTGYVAGDNAAKGTLKDIS